MVFTQNTTIKVPFNSTGNISGLHESWGDDETLFRVVNLNDSSFERREIFFEVDPGVYQAFQDNINSVSVSVVKDYPEKTNQADFTGEIVFNQIDVKDGIFSKSLVYPLWSFRGGKTVGVPTNSTELRESNAPSISLSPPAELSRIEVDGDAASMADAKIRRAMIEFKYDLLGEKKSKSVALLPDSDEILQTISLLHDKESKIQYRVRWFSKKGTQTNDWTSLDDTYLFLLPPSA